jgi:hypothetical protein
VTERRAKKRYRVQVPVTYGINDPDRSGVTEDVSEGGLFVRSAFTHPRNTILKIELTTINKESIVLIGKVRWTRRAHAGVRQTGLINGMGIQILRFISGLGFFAALCREDEQRAEH